MRRFRDWLHVQLRFELIWFLLPYTPHTDNRGRLISAPLHTTVCGQPRFAVFSCSPDWVCGQPKPTIDLKADLRQQTDGGAQPSNVTTHKQSSPATIGLHQGGCIYGIFIQGGGFRRPSLREALCGQSTCSTQQLLCSSVMRCFV